MKILSASEIRQADAYTIENEPISSIDLMERASERCSDWIVKSFFGDESLEFAIFVGPGNNGGDGLAIARHLAYCHAKVTVVIISEKISPDAQINLERLSDIEAVKVVFIKEIADIPDISSTIIVDALFGSGLTRPLEGFAAEVVNHINTIETTVISIDIPSGLFAENNPHNISSVHNVKNIVKATYTLTFEVPFLSFFFAENHIFTGKWIPLSIGIDKKFISETASQNFTLTKDYIQPLLKKRNKFAHKGHYGHCLLIAGSYGKMGAAVLASKACLRTGTGLLTTHIPKQGNEIMQTAVPEAMTSIDRNNKIIATPPQLTPYNAVAIGPGIGQNTAVANCFDAIIRSAEQPLVIDADGLNILSKRKELLEHLPKESILTPHPKEFERLAGETKNSYEQLHRQIELAKTHHIYIVLKGAHTSIACPDGSCYFNTTGNPGMATAGSGDVLTGIILSLLSQGYSAQHAALIGVFLHGLAGDLAAEVKSEEALIAGDIVEFLGNAFLMVNC